MDKAWKVILAFVGVFIAGAVFGGVFSLRASGKRLAIEALQNRAAPAAATQPAAAKKTGSGLAAPRGNPITPQLMRAFTRRISLTSEQKERIGPIVSRAGEDMLRLSQRNFEDTSRVTERMIADVSAVLSPEQRAELETMRRNWLEGLQKAKAERMKKMEAAAEEARGIPGATPTRPPER
jgi:hypothetical protein